MTYKELVKSIAKKTGNSEAEINRVMRAMAEVVMDAVEKKSEVTLIGIGKIRYSKMKARTGYSVLNQEFEEYPECYRLMFHFGKYIKDILRENKRFDKVKFYQSVKEEQEISEDDSDVDVAMKQLKFF